MSRCILRVVGGKRKDDVMSTQLTFLRVSDDFDLPSRDLWYCFNTDCFFEHSLLDDCEYLVIKGHRMCPACRQPLKRYDQEEFHGTL